MPSLFNLDIDLQRHLFPSPHRCTIEGNIGADDICRELGRDPNLVRNNFQAFVRKIKAKFPDL